MKHFKTTSEGSVHGLAVSPFLEAGTEKECDEIYRISYIESTPFYIPWGAGQLRSLHTATMIVKWDWKQRSRVRKSDDLQ